MIIPAFYWATTRTAGRMKRCPRCAGHPHRGWLGLSRGEGGAGMVACPARCNRGYMHFSFDKGHYEKPPPERESGIFGIAGRMADSGASFSDIAKVVGGGRRSGKNGGTIANKDDSIIGAGAAAVGGVALGSD